MLAANTGEAMVFGGAAGDLRWELTSESIVPTRTATRVDGERRLYAIVDDELVYAAELALDGRPYRPHLNGRLTRG